MAWRAITMVVMGALVLSACGGGDDEDGGGHDRLRGRGRCGRRRRGRGARRYIEGQDPDRFFYLGDVYDTGTAEEFERNYDPLYGDLAGRTDPVIGNHEYPNVESGYYPYWQGKRGWTEAQAKHRSYIDPESGWQVIAYSSETEPAAEARWVMRQIDKQDGTCRHRARAPRAVLDRRLATHGQRRPGAHLDALAGKTAINLAAHSHVYGRLEPIDGVTVIVSGQGGHDIRELGPQQHEVAASTAGATSVTRLVLRPGEAEVDPGGPGRNELRQRHDRMPESRREAIERLLEPNSLVARLPEPGEIAIALGIAIALLDIAGAVVGTDAYQGEGSIWDRMFSLANEKTVPAFFSGAVNLAGGLCAMVAARARLYGMHRIWIAFGALLTFMAVDEVVQIDDERIETWTGIDWDSLCRYPPSAAPSSGSTSCAERNRSPVAHDRRRGQLDDLVRTRGRRVRQRGPPGIGLHRDDGHRGGGRDGGVVVVALGDPRRAEGARSGRARARARGALGVVAPALPDPEMPYEQRPSRAIQITTPPPPQSNIRSAAANTRNAPPTHE